MTITAVWLDRTQARLAHYPRKKGKDVFRATHSEHHTHRPDSLDVQREEKSLFASLAQSLKDSTEIMIVGPGVAKHHFRNYLQEHHPLIARKVVVFQSMDHPTENQLQAFVERYLWSQSKAASNS